MIPLFGESNPDGKRDVREGRLISVALRHYQIAREPAKDSWPGSLFTARCAVSRNCLGEEPATRRNAVLNALSDS